MTALPLIRNYVISKNSIVLPNAVSRGVDKTALVSKLASEWGLFPRTSLEARTGCVVSAAQPLLGAI